MTPILILDRLCQEAKLFAEIESDHHESSLYGITDSKALGTYFEHKFQKYLEIHYTFDRGSSAKGIDFPGLNVDMKVTSYRQPQSSCPFKSARQKIYGLGYNLLIFVYDKTDDSNTKTGQLKILHSVLVTREKTADYQTTQGIQKLLENNANLDDLRYIQHLKNQVYNQPYADRIKVVKANFFNMDWKRIATQLPEPILFIGNPPS